MKKLESLIKTYSDFPNKGIAFKDVLGIIQDPEVFRELIFKMSSDQIIRRSEAIISVEARGFIFGSAIAFQASKPIIFARKPGKLPGEVIQENYNLEYGKNSLSIQTESVKGFETFAIIYDLLARGGTVLCVDKILRSLGKDISGIAVVVELKDLNARSKIDCPIDSQVVY